MNSSTNKHGEIKMKTYYMREMTPAHTAERDIKIISARNLTHAKLIAEAYQMHAGSTVELGKSLNNAYRGNSYITNVVTRRVNNVWSEVGGQLRNTERDVTLARIAKYAESEE
jgi:hypothetical protein